MELFEASYLLWFLHAWKMSPSHLLDGTYSIQWEPNVFIIGSVATVVVIVVVILLC